MKPQDWTKESAFAVDLRTAALDELWRVYHLASHGALDAPEELRPKWGSLALKARAELADRGQFTVPCPCCGHLTLHTRTYYDLCPVCFWENDLDQLEDPQSEHGPNGYSLLDGQRNYAQTGSSHPSFAAKVRRPLDSEKLDPGWRAIDLRIDRFAQATVEEFRNMDLDLDLYYWRPTYWLAASASDG